MEIKNILFSPNVSFEEKFRIRSQYKDFKEPYFINSNRALISPTAIKISKRIKEEFDIDLFPCINVTKTKGYPESANFAMVDKYGNEYLFFDTSTSFTIKKNQIDYANNEFYIQTP